MRYHKYKEKIRTKSGAWRYIYDTVKEGLTSSGSDSSNYTDYTPRDNKDRKRKKRSLLPKKKTNTKTQKAIQEYKKKMSEDGANYLDSSNNPKLDYSAQAKDITDAANALKKSKKFKDLF